MTEVTIELMLILLSPIYAALGWLLVGHVSLKEKVVRLQAIVECHIYGDTTACLDVKEVD